jgi:YidC/Oxa1 family membrane protein insertase
MPFVDAVTTLVSPVRSLVAWVLVRAHDLLSTLGLDPTGGAVWALAVIALVVTVRLVLVPLVVQQVRGAHAMSAVQPELARIQQKYRGRPGAAAAEALRREQQEALRAARANPLAGCLPALLQAPVLYALFSVLDGIRRGQAVGLLTPTLVQQAGAASIGGASLSATLSAATSGSTSAAAVALIVLMCAGQVIASALAARNRPTVDPAQPMAGVIRWMPYVLPLGLAVTAVHFPVGVLLYWATSALWSVGQQLVVNRLLPHPGR